MKNFWSRNLIKKKQSEIKTILFQQADYLGKMTKNIIKAEVETKIAAFQTNPQKKYFNHHFVIKSAALKYSFVLFYVRHSINSEYPLAITVPENMTLNASEIKNEKEFSEKLKLIFSDKKTTEIINSLIAQS